MYHCESYMNVIKSSLIMIKWSGGPVVALMCSMGRKIAPHIGIKNQTYGAII